MELTSLAVAATTARPVDAGGWIGRWSPGIGDPTAVGWLTVGLYLAAAWSSWRLVRSKGEGLTPAERFVWRAMTIGLAALGVNKQLDLQSAVTALGRMVAFDQGWYDARREVQLVFIVGVGALALLIGFGLLALMRHLPAATNVTITGVWILLTFIVIRAASFHHVDVFISTRFWGFRGNWLLEVGGLAVVLLGVSWRRWAAAGPAATLGLPSALRHPPPPRRWARLCLEAPRRRPLLVVVPAALALLGGLAAGRLAPPRYRSSAVVRAEWDEKGGETGWRAAARAADRQLQHVRGRLLSRSAIESVLQAVDPYGPSRARPVAPAQQFREMAASVSVEPAGVDTFAIHCTHDDASIAARVSNHLASLLEADSAAERAYADPGPIETRLTEARKAFEEKHSALLRAEEGRKGDSGAAPGGRERLDAERTTLEARLAAARGRAEELRKATEGGGPPAATVPLDPGPELRQLHERVAELRLRYTEEHPDVLSLRRRIRRLEEGAPAPPPDPIPAAPSEAETRGAPEEIANLEKRKAELDAAYVLLMSRERSARPETLNLESLRTEDDDARRASVALEEEWRTAETAFRFGRGRRVRFQTLRAASAPQAPYTPDNVTFGLVALGLGLVLGLGAAVAAELKNRPA